MSPKILCLRLARALGLFRVSKRLTRDLPRILCYHGGSLGDEYQFNPKLFMREKTFRDRLNWLHRHGFAVTTLDDAVERMTGSSTAGNTSERCSVVFTFDDGWHSTVESLLPVLQQHGHPATLYLATKVFRDRTPVIDVTLGYLFWKCRLDSFTLSGFGPDIDRTWNRTEPDQRRSLLGHLNHSFTQITRDPQRLRQQLVNLAEQMGVGRGGLDLDSLRFDYADAAALQRLPDQGCRIELHGHTHHYPLGDPEALTLDVKTCAAVIDSLQLNTPRHYCYPSGVFDRGAEEVLPTLGVVSATTCIPDAARRTGRRRERYALPRFLDGEDVSLIEFEAEMSGFAYYLRGARDQFMAILRRRKSQPTRVPNVQAGGRPRTSADEPRADSPRC